MRKDFSQPFHNLYGTGFMCISAQDRRKLSPVKPKAVGGVIKRNRRRSAGAALAHRLSGDRTTQLPVLLHLSGVERVEKSGTLLSISKQEFHFLGIQPHSAAGGTVIHLDAVVLEHHQGFLAGGAVHVPIVESPRLRRKPVVLRIPATLCGQRSCPWQQTL